MPAEPETTEKLPEEVARLMCRQRGLDPDRKVIAGKMSAPTEVRPTWEFWISEAREIIDLVKGAI